MIRCLAIDDEPLALTQLTGYIRQTPFLEETGSCHSALQALEIMSREPVDLVFVDIDMPDLNGMDFVRSLFVKPMVVFTTAYSEYAVEGFQVDALDYLLKPIGYPHFLKAATKARNQYELTKRAAVTGVQTGGERQLFVKADYKMVQVNMDSILYVEGQNEYIKIHTDQGRPIMTLLSMKAIEEKLPSEHFMRVHRSYIVNLQRIDYVSRGRIQIGKEITIPVSDQYREAFNSYLDKYSLLRE